MRFQKALLKGVIQVVLIGAVVAGLVLAAGRFLPGFSVFSSTKKQHSTEVVSSVTMEKQVILMRLGIQGISEASANGKIFGVDVPGSDRTTFLQYNFRAQLGVDGKDVAIREVAEHQYQLTVPPFVFLGHDQVQFKLVAEKNGVLSAVTPKIDQVEMVNKILSSDAQKAYLAEHQEALKEQARSFYEGIIKGIDPAATVTFEYRS